MRNRAPLVLLAALLVVALPAVMTAEEAGPGPRMGRKSGIGLRGLELTEVQRQKLEELRLEQVKAVAGLRAELEVKQAELAAFWRAEQLDAKSIIAWVKQISGLREKLAVARAEQRLAMFNLLTPEQRAQFRDAVRGQGRRGRGMRGEGMQGKGHCGQCERGGCADHGEGKKGGHGGCGGGGCPGHKATDG